MIEDGSINDAKDVIELFNDKLNLRYFVKENEGQGFTRNYGFERAKGDYFVIFDSDCIIPEDYLQIVNDSLSANWLDAYGGPDAAHASFTDVQKAISYSMTSPFTTGGIRGNKKGIGQFHPRSFNMGVSRKVWEKVGGFIITRSAEDIEYSIRIQANGFKIGLIPNAKVYHKRRTNFLQFYKQIHFFGRARINLYKFFPKELKAIHFFPALFTLGLLFVLAMNIFWWMGWRNIRYPAGGPYFVDIFSCLVEKQISKSCIFERHCCLYSTDCLRVRIYAGFLEACCIKKIIA